MKKFEPKEIKKTYINMIVKFGNRGLWGGKSFSEKTNKKKNT